MSKKSNAAVGPSKTEGAVFKSQDEVEKRIESKDRNVAFNPLRIPPSI